MTTVIFIHGTSVREPEFSETFELIKSKLHDELPEINVVPCSWGNSLGAKLNAEGASIPLYDSSRNSDEVSKTDEKIIRWQQLYQDPLYELRLLSLKTTEEEDFILGQDDPGEILDEKVQDFIPSKNLQDKLKEGGIFEVFNQALEKVTNSNPYRDALETVSDITEHRNAIARAIIAQAIAIIENKKEAEAVAFSEKKNEIKAEGKKSELILTDAILRDEIVKSLSYEIIDSKRGAISWLKEHMSQLVLSKATNHIKRKRGSITDVTYPIVGDILLYQARGQKIRDFIKSYIDDADSPVILIAHSLGGIACVDLLIQEKLNEKVKLLVTVGSQAPFFYEINALQSLEYGEPLPSHFPSSWLNLYDLNDVLSYIGANIFPKKVQDILIDNQQPFPRSHGAYWTNSATWKVIIKEIKTIRRKAKEATISANSKI